MSEQVIKLSDNAAKRIKLIMSAAEHSTIGVRIGVKSEDVRWHVLRNGVCKRNKTQ